MRWVLKKREEHVQRDAGLGTEVGGSGQLKGSKMTSNVLRKLNNHIRYKLI
jgi:hypothetical protein